MDYDDTGKFVDSVIDGNLGAEELLLLSFRSVRLAFHFLLLYVLMHPVGCDLLDLMRQLTSVI